MAQPWQ